MPAVESEIELPSEIANKLEEYNCPINMEIMVDPVTLSCGHSFEKNAIQKWYAQRHTCPCCRADEQRNNVFRQTFEVNEVLQDEISLFLAEYRAEASRHLFIFNFVLDALNFRNYRFIINHFSDHRAYLNKHIYEGNSILHLAIKEGRFQLVKLLIDSFDNLDLNLKTQNTGNLGGNTPLHLACMLSDTRILRFLLKNQNVDPQNVNANGQSALVFAINLKRAHQVSALIDSRKTDINYFCENSYPAIFSAIDSRDDQIVRIITKSERFDVNAKGHMDQKPLFMAANKGYTYAAKELLRCENVDIESRCFLLQDRSALLIAHLNDAHGVKNLIINSPQFESFILKLIKDENIKDLVKNLSDIYQACDLDFFYRNMDLCRSKMEFKKCFCISIFKRSIYPKFTRKLLAKIISKVIDKKDFDCIANFIICNSRLLNSPLSKDGFSLLHYAVRKKSFQVVEFLTQLHGINLNKTINTNIGSHRGFTALHFAATLDSPRILNLLIQKGAFGRLRDFRGMTPYMRAIEHNKTENIRILARYRR